MKTNPAKVCSLKVGDTVSLPRDVVSQMKVIRIGRFEDGLYSGMSDAAVFEIECTDGPFKGQRSVIVMDKQKTVDVVSRSSRMLKLFNKIKGFFSLPKTNKKKGS